jgi:hypothetical protein
MGTRRVSERRVERPDAMVEHGTSQKDDIRVDALIGISNDERTPSWGLVFTPEVFHLFSRTMKTGLNETHGTSKSRKKIWVRKHRRSKRESMDTHRR